MGGGVSEGAVDAAEKELGVRFPPDLKQYLSRFGHIEVGHFEFFGLGDGIPDHLEHRTV